MPAHRFYEDKALFLFAGTEYDRAQFELLIVCAYNPKLEMSCFETAWDRVPEVHSRALALNACFERLAGDLGLLSSGSSLTIKSNSGDTAKVKYPHQQFLHTMRGVIEGYKLTEDEVKILLNSVAFNTLFNALFHCYKDTYRGNNAVLHSRKHAHSSECVQRYAYGVLSREGGCLFDAVQMFKAKLRRYVAHVKDVDSVPNLDWLLELFPTRETWKNPVIWAQYQAYLAALRAGDDEPVPWEEYLTILADGEVEAD